MFFLELERALTYRFDLHDVSICMQIPFVILSTCSRVEKLVGMWYALLFVYDIDLFIFMTNDHSSPSVQFLFKV